MLLSTILRAEEAYSAYLRAASGRRLDHSSFQMVIGHFLFIKFLASCIYFFSLGCPFLINLLESSMYFKKCPQQSSTRNCLTLEKHFQELKITKLHAPQKNVSSEGTGKKKKRTNQNYDKLFGLFDFWAENPQSQIFDQDLSCMAIYINTQHRGICFIFPLPPIGNASFNSKYSPCKHLLGQSYSSPQQCPGRTQRRNRFL